jgi:hypothetical protein
MRAACIGQEGRRRVGYLLKSSPRTALLKTFISTISRHGDTLLVQATGQAAFQRSDDAVRPDHI